MHVPKGEHDLQRQRDQRQYRTPVSMAMNPAHPPSTPKKMPRRVAIPVNMLTLHCNAKQEDKVFEAIL